MFLANEINVDIVINDQKIIYFSSLNISQSFNAHHQFELILNQDVIEDTVGFKIEQSKNWIGTPFIVTLNNGAMNFKGIVCEVNLSQSHGLRGDLIIRGASPTIILDAGGQIRSFNETNLASIAKYLTKAAAQELDCKISPAYENDITYITQFKESNFSFLNRLSAEYGEFFFYDGRVLHFGKPQESKEVELVHGQNLKMSAHRRQKRK